MRKYSRLSGLLLCVLMLCISGCGGSGGSAADPMGTATVQFIDEAGKILFPEEGGSIFAFVIMPGESRQLIVKVTNARSDGSIVPVVNEYVSFTLLTPANGGSIRMVTDRTDSSGRAIAMYTSGNNYVMDEIRATTEAGASAQLTILKTGGLVGKQIASLTPSSVLVPDGATSVIQALVTDGNGNPVMGETVLFSFTVNASGAYFVTASQADVGTFSATTDASGRAQAVYRAGGNQPNQILYDTIRAALSNGSTQSVMITRTAGTVPGALSISVSADPTSVAAGNVSIITAAVTGENNSGVTVTFWLSDNNSGATLSATSAVTDGSGNASVTYAAGSNNPTVNVDDVVRASVGSASASVIITRTASGGVAAYAISVQTSPTSVTAGQVSIITATVTSGSTPASGVVVAFTLPVNQSGATLSAASATTDGNGKAVVIYRPGGTNPDTTLQDTVQASVGTATDAKAITRTGSSTISYSIDITANPSTLTQVHNNSVVTATVTNNAGTPISAVTVNFTVVGASVGTVSPASAITDGSGNAVTVYTGGLGPGATGVVVSSITIGGNTYTDAVTIKNP